ncbi:EAL domain-containing protein [Colwellia psychrerythraea]|uniref:cyclic-guanylate-specific phosphodiesterase n=1 Tax=Colwellia psychrerythraea TaxID=28229 RepID=A0A099KB91_COLPS|nr:EAL domain-containing protein [Colwellia psychrerythraea]KGJ87555.1 response regulator receiver modulated diguanylate phosphodiesterase [Colwellia psychrerythraea]
MMNRVFIVDDDTLTCNLLNTLVKPIFGSVEVFQNPSDFLSLSLNEQDFIILDLMMPDMDGIEVIRHLAEHKCPASLILISGYDSGVLHSAETLALSCGLNVINTFTKPINTEILTCFLTSLSAKQAQRELVKCSNDKEKQGSFDFIPTKQDLQYAIENKQLILYYQPQINMKTGCVHGAEVLVRWLHPEFGLIFPDKFIALAEQTGLIEQLSEEVIHLAIMQSVYWQKRNKATRLSINISAQNITSLKLPEQLRMLVKEYEIDPSMIVLELTESALMDSEVTSLDIFTRFRLKGFQLSIDDFGTGYSSLSQLHKIPFTELKIDQSFVTNMKQEKESAAIVETCIMLAHKLNMEVVAEGIEDKATWDLLSSEDCDIAQGYYIARPMPAEQFDKWQFKG